MKHRILLPLLFALLSTFLFITTAAAEPINVNFVTIEDYIVVKDQTTLIDVRSANSREGSNLGVKKAIWIDPKSGSALQDFIATADKSLSYTIFCSCVDDNYSIRAAQLLVKNGFKNVVVLKGGWDALYDNSTIELAPFK